MSGIIKRQALMDYSHDMPEVLDYSLVQTSLGTMVEIGSAFQKTPEINKFPDRLDQLNRVDGLVPFNPDKIQGLFEEVR